MNKNYIEKRSINVAELENNKDFLKLFGINMNIAQ